MAEDGPALPTELQAVVPAAEAAPSLSGDEDFHCPNCLFLEDPLGDGGFWACQNLCIRG